MDHEPSTEAPVDRNLIARASVIIDAPVARVWNTLIDPEAIEKYMFGAKVETDWREGSPIVWEGEWKGKPFRDKGVILQFSPNRILQYTLFSPMAGQPDIPENYHTVTIDVAEDGEATRVSLTQDNNTTPEERQHSEENWATMLEALKKQLAD